MGLDPKYSWKEKEKKGEISFYNLYWFFFAPLSVLYFLNIIP